jgi:predicted PurR-regulated permease PerM
MRWQEYAAAGPAAISEEITPYIRQITGWLLSEVGSLGGVLIQFFLTVVIAAILYQKGEIAAAALTRFARRVGGAQGESLVILAGKAIQAVALGIVVTAMTQSALSGIGLAIAGVPYPGVLTAIIFVLCVAQLGPVIVFLPAIVWLYWQGESGWAIALLVWAIPVTALDGFLRPVLIKRSVDLPLLLIFTGVIGGLIAYGIIGLFLGPVLLAVGYTLLAAWVDEEGMDASTP